jgi:multiple sugar transport system permease protein
LLLWRDDLFNRIALGLLLVPATVTPLVVGLMFKALLSPEYGPLGFPLADMGLTAPRGLLADPHWALATMVVIDAWEWTPLMALILLAGLKSLPTDILEAAASDGASALKRFRLVIWPLLLPSLFLALILRMMDAFRVFDTIFVSTGGGPGEATETLMLYGVKQGLQFFNIGTASAVSTVIVVCILVMAAAFIGLIRPARNRNA